MSISERLHHKREVMSPRDVVRENTAREMVAMSTGTIDASRM